VSLFRLRRDARRLAAGGLVAVALSVAGCGPGGAQPATAPVPTPVSVAATPSSPAVPSAASPSAPAASTPAAPSRPGAPAGSLAGLRGKVIAVDPGHNGNAGAHPEIINKLHDAVSKWKPCETTGTQTNAGYQEAAFTFDVGMRLAAILRAAGATVVLTRTTNTGVGPCFDERAWIGNRAHANAAVSIHADGAPASAHGFHVLVPVNVHGPSTPILGPSRQLGLAIRDAYRAGTGLPPANYIGTDGINPRSDMGGLNLSTVPKVMLECGNMRNSGDAAKLSSAAFRQRVAAAIAAGLAKYLS
jgi:N-acetylmuramoyl-L-alanine amidase